MGYGDPHALDVLGQALIRLAQDLATDAERHGHSARTVHWVSTAAAAHRREVDRDVTDVVNAARQLEDAGRALVEHAQTMRERIQAIARIEREAQEWFTHTAHSVVGGVEHAAVSVIKKIVHVAMPWEHWLWHPHNLLPSGDVTWLEVGDYLARKGVLQWTR